MKKKHYHLIGIAGIGMSGLARILLNQGHRVSGSDLAQNTMTDALAEKGVIIYSGHESAFIGECDYVIYSSAIQSDNPEWIAAENAGIPIVARVDLLAEIMEGFYQVVIAGSHGKTTTTSLATHLLLEAKLDPSYAIGGVLNQQGVNAHLGKGQYIVVEADESDASFLKFKPDVAIITNVDSDHLDFYENNIACLEKAFSDFMSSVSETGHLIVCIDDPRLYRLAQQLERPVIAYSVQDHPDADYRATEIKTAQGISQFNLIDSNNNQTTFQLSMPGQHNVSNALSSIILADLLKIPRTISQKALQFFPGVGRRFQTSFLKNLTVVNDYGHHPREIAVTLNAARDNWPDQKITLVFQPHRFTRTKQLFHEFVEVLSHVDELILLDIYSANELPIANADSDALAENISQKTKVIRLSGQSELLAHAQKYFAKHAIVIMQGAGSIGTMVQPLIDSFEILETHEAVT